MNKSIKIVKKWINSPLCSVFLMKKWDEIDQNPQKKQVDKKRDANMNHKIPQKKGKKFICFMHFNGHKCYKNITDVDFHKKWTLS